jgi:hypothetical protein
LRRFRRELGRTGACRTPTHRRLPHSCHQPVPHTSSTRAWQVAAQPGLEDALGSLLECGEGGQLAAGLFMAPCPDALAGRCGASAPRDKPRRCRGLPSLTRLPLAPQALLALGVARRH